MKRVKNKLEIKKRTKFDIKIKWNQLTNDKIGEFFIKKWLKWNK
jgi:hypothetical protein